MKVQKFEGGSKKLSGNLEIGQFAEIDVKVGKHHITLMVDCDVLGNVFIHKQIVTDSIVKTNERITL